MYINITKKNMTNSLTFHDLCVKLDEIVQCPEKNEKKSKLHDIFNSYNQHKPNRDESFQLMRLLLPQLDKTRRTYGLKHQTIIKSISKAFNTPERSNYQTILEQHCRITDSKMTLDDVNKNLDDISTASMHFKNVLLILSARELKWLIRIVLKDLKLGLTASDILTGYDPGLIEPFRTTNNLSDILNRNVGEGIQLNTFVRPMLSVKATPHLLTSINVHGHYVEEKLDGERFQLHYGPRIDWFSRNGNKWNDTFKHLERTIRALLPATLTSAIFDGEMLGYDRADKTYATKGFNYDIKKSHASSQFQPSFKIFDVLYVNGTSVIRRTLDERKKILAEIVPRDKPGVFMRVESRVINHVNDIVTLLNASIHAHLEGIVLKDPRSYYAIDERSSAWVKIKAEYFDDLLVELDLLILGGYYKQGVIRSFLLGVSERTDGGIRFKSMATCGLGLTRREMDALTTRLLPHWRTMDVGVRDVMFGREKPHVWIEPKDSVVLELKASELQRSGQFVTSHTLRFGRIVKIRYDKPYYDCLTTDELREMIANGNDNVVKLFKREATIGDFVIDRQPTVSKVEPTRKKPKLDDVESTTLDGLAFHVLNGNDAYPKSHIERLIARNGGDVVEKLDKSRLNVIVIAAFMDFKVDVQVRAGERNVVKLDWLLRVLDRQKLDDIKPNESFALTNRETKRSRFCFDRYSDSYGQVLGDLDELRKLLRDVPNLVENLDLGGF